MDAGTKARFEAKVDRSGGPDACHLWTGSRGEGYGRIFCGGRLEGAHRVAWAIAHGPIPEGPGHHGTCVLHRCDVRACVNPAHLFLGSVADNNRDMAGKGRLVLAPPMPGERNGRAKLTGADVAEIRRRVAAGEARASLGKEFGVSGWQVTRIVSGTRWRDARGEP